MHAADSVRVLYQNLDYDAAERLALETLDSGESISIEDRAELHFLVGLVNYVRSDSVTARADFETVFSLNPNYLPDPILVPPRVLAFFNRVRSDARPHTPGDLVRTRYVMVYDLRPGAALRSAVLPGWGQIYRGDVGKGGVMAGAWVATAGTALTLTLLGNGNDDVRGVRIAAMSTAGIVWLYSYLDALLVPGYTSSDGVRVTPMLTHESAGVRAALHF
jgi:hypothetical protein